MEQCPFCEKHFDSRGFPNHVKMHVNNWDRHPDPVIDLTISMFNTQKRILQIKSDWN